MKIDLYLAYVHPQGWGVFLKDTCPTTQNVFPSWMFRHYEVEEKNYQHAFDRLLAKKTQLDRLKIIPTKGREGEIFHELSDLEHASLSAAVATGK